jgi:hypothetical protein
MVGSKKIISFSYMNAVALNKAKHSDSFSVAASPPLQSCACWRRYVSGEYSEVPR